MSALGQKVLSLTPQGLYKFPRRKSTIFRQEFWRRMGFQFTRLGKKKFVFSYLRATNIFLGIGEMIMTFPGAFHFGFSFGDNLAEAANFVSMN